MKKKLFGAFIWLVVFGIFTGLCFVIDVTEYSLAGTTWEVGFSGMNLAVHESLGFKESWYTVSEYLGYVAFLPVAVFALMGLWQLVKGKSLKKVDGDIYCLAVTYVIMLVLYVVFDKLPICYRPVLIENELETSYPSSHTMLAVCIMGTTMLQLASRVHKQALKVVLMATCALLGILIVVSRFLSGAHWTTDILGSLLISAAVVTFYSAMTAFIKEHEAK